MLPYTVRLPYTEVITLGLKVVPLLLVVQLILDGYETAHRTQHGQDIQTNQVSVLLLTSNHSHCSGLSVTSQSTFILSSPPQYRMRERALRQ